MYYTIYVIETYYLVFKSQWSCWVHWVSREGHPGKCCRSTPPTHGPRVEQVAGRSGEDFCICHYKKGWSA